MPFSSRAQWNYCFAAKKPGWDCGKWAHETPGAPKARYRKLPLKVAKKAAPCTCAALKGESLGPGITRIRGNLCNVHGRYGPCDGKAPAPKKGGSKGGAGKGRKPAKSETERAQEREATQRERDKLRIEQQAKNRADVLRSLNIAPDGQAALEALRRGEQPDPAALARAGFVKAGLVEQAADGSYRMTPAGRALLSAADAGDRGRAGDTISGGRDRTTARDTRTAATAERKRAAEAKRAAADAKPAKQAGGGKEQSPPPKKMPRLPGNSSAPKPVTAGGGGGKAGSGTKTPAASPALQSAANAVLDGTATPAQVTQLVRAGLARQRKDGSVSLTARGLTAVREKENRQHSDAGGQPVVVSERASPRTDSTDQVLLDSHYTTDSISPSFLVLKDATGAYRWVSFSSNAYRDRDGEIVSTKALEDDVARADAAQTYGPLRWWHVGTPLGSGLDIGVCDFNAMHGRMLIESGTFTSERIARAVAKAAPNLQVSIGFVHPPSDPDATGVFHHIHRFERSLVPTGRAANPFTKLVVKETLDMASIKERWDSFVSLMGGEEAAREVVQSAEFAQKTADDAGVVYKAETEDAPPTEITLNGVTYVVKAASEDAPPPVEKDDGQGDIEAMADDDGGGGEMSADEFLDAIDARMSAKLAPFAALLDMERKMASHVQSLMQPYTAKKDADDAERAHEIATLKAALDQQQAAFTEAAARLAALEGDQPAMFGGGYIASAANNTIATKEQAAALGAPASDDNDPFADIRKHLLGLGVSSPNGV